MKHETECGKCASRVVVDEKYEDALVHCVDAVRNSMRNQQVHHQGWNELDIALAVIRALRDFRYDVGVSA